MVKTKMKKVLILASGLSAKQYDDYDYKANGWTVVAVNNGWMAAENQWDYWVRANDYKGSRPTKILPHQTEVKRYGDSLRKYGGHHLCGYSITLCASYYSLDVIKPKVIGYLGADMNYEPNENGDTHIYGVGYDIQKNGIPDPDRMIKRYGGDDPKYITRIYNRFADIAEKEGVKIYNFSIMENTRLPYNKIDVSNL
jgi:hypothetical protein